jgi:hypothetical protein
MIHPSGVYRIPAGLVMLVSIALHAQQPREIPQLRLVEEARIDGGGADISEIGMTLLLCKGGVAFVEPQDFRLRIYDALVREVARFGRRGEGPGEFSMGMQVNPIAADVRIGVIGDTIWAFNARRFSLLTTQGRLIRTFAQPATLPGGGARSGQPPAGAGARRMVLSFDPNALLPDGSILGRTTWGRIESVRMNGRNVLLNRESDHGFAVASPSGGIIREIAALPPTTLISVERQGQQWGVKVPYLEEPYVSVAPDGSRIGIATTTIASVQSGSLRIVIIGVHGDTLVARNLAFTPVAFSKRAADSEIAGRTKGFKSTRGSGPPATPPDVVTELESRTRAALPKAASAYGGMFIGADNTIWLMGQRRTDGSRHYHLLDERGNLLGTMGVPKHTSLTSASTRTTVWAEQTDENGVGSLVRYRVVR